MPAPSISKDEAEARYALIEQCLCEGFLPRGIAPKAGQIGAIREAYIRANPERRAQGVDGRGGAYNWYDRANRALGRDVDWTLYKPSDEPIGRAPVLGDVPGDFRIKGRSTLYTKDGEVALEWVKTSIDAERQAAMLQETLNALAEDVPRASPSVPIHTHSSPTGLLNLYVLTDYHMGMKAWHEEAGDDWDVRIAEDLLIRWFTAAIAQAPQADVAILGQLGDFLHADGLEALTPASKHLLDVDTRHQKVVRYAIRVLRRVIQMLAEKYPRVHIIMADANHDPVSGIWLRELFAMHYQDDPRISVETSPEAYYCYEHGLTSLFFHHGHKRKVVNVDDVLAARFRDVFGRTQFSYAHMGHLHSRHVLESNLMVVEQHRTLAAKDAYTARGGWLSGREANVITYSAKHGEVGRITLTPEMVDV